MQQSAYTIKQFELGQFKYVCSGDDIKVVSNYTTIDLLNNAFDDEKNQHTVREHYESY